MGGNRQGIRFNRILSPVRPIRCIYLVDDVLHCAGEYLPDLDAQPQRSWGREAEQVPEGMNNDARRILSYIWTILTHCFNRVHIVLYVGP